MLLTQKQKRNLSETKWYHATLKRHLPSILSGIRADYNHGHELDFGTGFYVTSDFEQARKYINTLVEFYNQEEIDFLANDEEVGVILEFTLENLVDIFEGSEYSSHYFAKHKEAMAGEIDFAEFVFQNRLEPKRRIHAFDFIYGVQTDDNPTGLVQEFKAGLKTKDEVLSQFRKPYSFKQLSIHNQSFCDIMKVDKIYLSKNGEELQQWDKFH
ncbi:TPA: DUF3990 domain-containing protein [Streptococcus suis]